MNVQMMAIFFQIYAISPVDTIALNARIVYVIGSHGCKFWNNCGTDSIGNVPAYELKFYIFSFRTQTK
jgi:hypothetical protein